MFTSFQNSLILLGRVSTLEKETCTVGRKQIQLKPVVKQTKTEWVMVYYCAGQKTWFHRLIQPNLLAG